MVNIHLLSERADELLHGSHSSSGDNHLLLWVAIFRDSCF
jgi:hypothetical protein